MKKTDYLIITNTQTPEGIARSKADIIVNHTTPVGQGGKGWNRPGIDYLITLDGTLEVVVDENHPSQVDLWGISQGTNGLLGTARIVAFVGGRDKDNKAFKDTRTKEQIQTLETLVRFFSLRFPKTRILGWNDIPAFNSVNIPGFDLKKWLEDIGVTAEKSPEKKPRS